MGAKDGRLSRLHLPPNLGGGLGGGLYNADSEILLGEWIPFLVIRVLKEILVFLPVRGASAPFKDAFPSSPSSSRQVTRGLETTERKGIR